MMDQTHRVAILNAMLGRHGTDILLMAIDEYKYPVDILDSVLSRYVWTTEKPTTPGIYWANGKGRWSRISMTIDGLKTPLEVNVFDGSGVCHMKSIRITSKVHSSLRESIFCRHMDHRKVKVSLSPGDFGRIGEWHREYVEGISFDAYIVSMKNIYDLDEQIEIELWSTGPLSKTKKRRGASGHGG